MGCICFAHVEEELESKGIKGREVQPRLYDFLIFVVAALRSKGNSQDGSVYFLHCASGCTTYSWLMERPTNLHLIVSPSPSPHFINFPSFVHVPFSSFSSLVRLILDALSCICAESGLVPGHDTLSAQPVPSKDIIRLPLRRVKRQQQYHSLQRRQTTLPSNTSAALFNDVDLWEVAVQVEIGSPAQPFLLLLDTGSSDTWVPSAACTALQGCPGKDHYNPQQSSTYAATDYVFNVTYATGNAFGQYFIDQIQIGNLTLPKQVLASVNSSAGPLAKQESSDTYILDGVFGAGYPTGSSMYQLTQKPFYPIPMALWDAELISQPILSSTSVKVRPWSG